MNKPRFALLVLLLLGSLMALGRVGLEVGSWLIENSDPHALQWAGLALALAGTFAVFAVIADVIAFGPRGRGRELGASRLGVMLTIVSILAIVPALLACSSCSALSKQGRAVAGDVIDCTTAAASEFDEQFGPVVDKVLEQAIAGDGGIDWPTVRESTKKLATTAAKCVLARAVARLMHPPAADADAPQSAGLEVDQERLQSAWRQLADGQTYRTPYGDL